MDPITQKFLGEFCKSFEIDENKTDTSFEHFVIIVVLIKRMALLILNLKKCQRERMHRE